LCIRIKFAALFSKSMAISFFPLQKQQSLRKEPLPFIYFTLLNQIIKSIDGK
jgi:hypothetical protein